MTSYGTAVRQELHLPTRELRHAIPAVYAGYKELHDAATIDPRVRCLVCEVWRMPASPRGRNRIATSCPVASSSARHTFPKAPAPRSLTIR